ncbi:MAG: hypothetical protein M3015_00835, partial [Bacteroidota bacterium]|nr:hypothetical protein [Bacteroidota bacterium]
MKKAVIIAGVLLILITIIYLSFNNNAIKEDPRGKAYAGSKTCVSCHSNIYNSYIHTAHYIGSGQAAENTLHGSFSSGNNIFHINDSQKIVMEKLDSGFFQSYYLNGKLEERYRFDIVLGGVKGESYLYWKDNKLYQLPLSYFSREHQWSTSPGYGFNFLASASSRSIKKQCLECHASYISDLPAEEQGFNKEEKFDKSSLVVSIDCERCHGPAAEHADFQTHNPEVKTAHFITTYSSLNRSQKIDMCAICHSGKPIDKLRSTFEFVPGDSFSKFKIPELYTYVDTSRLDVHGNQLQLLQSSKCYTQSSLTCTTCHDVHQNTRGQDAVYVQKCLACHNTSHKINCTMKDGL